MKHRYKIGDMVRIVYPTNYKVGKEYLCKETHTSDMITPNMSKLDRATTRVVGITNTDKYILDITGHSFLQCWLKPACSTLFTSL